MRRFVLSVLFLVAIGCSGSPEGGKFVESPELLKAVPSDALTVGIFGRCDHALERMLDSTSVLRQLDYGKFGRHKAAVAFCNIGSITPLLILETGIASQDRSSENAKGSLQAATDTLTQTRDIAKLADSLKLYTAQVALDKHNVLLISPSATVITVAERHLESESSILDAPYFDLVLEAMSSGDAIAWRNSGAAKLLSIDLAGIPRKQVAGFIKNAAEWTVGNGNKLKSIQPASAKYFCNFLEAAGEGQSKFARVCPSDAELIIDIPIGELKQWRQAYETMLDARVELESYKKKLQAINKSAGRNPLDWERENNIQEVVYVACKDYSINMVRTGKAVKSIKEKQVGTNPACGFLNALYGYPFSDADSCVVRKGDWLISGRSSVLDSLALGNIKNWPAKACAIVQIPGERLTCNKDNITIWQDSNR